MKYDVSGIGNPLLDFTLKVDDDFLNSLGFKRGGMFLVGKEEAQNLLKKIENCKIKTSPGGSVANVLAGVSFLGGKTALLGKIGDDENGEKYSKYTKESGTEVKLVKDSLENSGYAITFITPDGERTFAVHLGAALSFTKEDVDLNSIEASTILHLEGFKVEDCKSSGVLQYAIDAAKKNGTKISLDLSDADLIERNLDYLKRFVQANVDIVFANETEAEAFTGKKEKEALQEISAMCELAVVKLGEKGSLLKRGDTVYTVEPIKTTVENTNGAGDMYAAGILFGIANDMSLEKAGEMASYFSSQIVARESARLEGELKDYDFNDKI